MKRPVTRGDCSGVPRPCPWRVCRYHLQGAEQNRQTFPPAGAPTCALDVADAGGATLEEVGAIFGLTRERIRQVEALALVKLRLRASRAGLEGGAAELSRMGDRGDEGGDEP